MTTNTLFCPDTIRSELRDKFVAVAAAFNAMEQTARMLTAVSGKSADTGYLESFLDSCYQDYINELLAKASAQYAGIGATKLTMSDFYRVIELNVNDFDREARNEWLGDRIDPSADHNTQYAQRLAEAFPAEAFAASLLEQAHQLEDRGLQEAANTIVSDLWLAANRLYSEYKPRSTKTKISFFCSLYQCSFGGYSNGTPEKIIGLMSALRVMAEETGAAGISCAAGAIANSFRGLGYSDTFYSRTKLAEGMAMEAVVYKEKMELRFSHEDAESLIAFLRLHSDKELCMLDALEVAA